MNVTVTLTSEQIEAFADIVADKLAARTAAERGQRENEWMGVKEAAFYAGCSIGRMRKLIERRRIPFSQDGPGRRVFVSRSDLDRFMHDNRNERRRQ